MDLIDTAKGWLGFAKKDQAFGNDVELALADPLVLFDRTQFQQYNPNLLVRSKGLGIFDKIRRDEQAKAALLFKKHMVMSSGWMISPPDGKDAVEHEATQFIKSQLSGLSGTLERNVQNIMTALDYGYSITEKVFMTVDEGKWAGKAGLKALKTRKPHSFTFKQDEYGNLIHVVQQTMDGAKDLPIEKFVIYSYMDDFGNPYGTSDLDSAYRPWWFKDHAYKWLGMYLERFGIPPIFALYNKDKYKGPTLDKLKSALKNLQAATSGVIPRGEKEDIELWTPEVAGQAARVFLPILEKYDTDIAKSILMPGQLGVSPETSTGSQARAVKIFEMFMMIVETLRKEIAETIINEQIVKPLYNLNYTDQEDCPYFKWNPIDDDANLELLKTWSGMVGASVVINTPEDEAHIRASMKFPERDSSNDPEPGEDDDPDDDNDPEPEPIKDDDEDDDEKDNTHLETHAFREKNQYEKRLNFKQIDRNLLAAEKQGFDNLNFILTLARDQVLKRYGNKKVTEKMVRSVKTLPNMNQFKSALNTFMVDLLDAGRDSFRNEVAAVFTFKDEGPNFTPTAAISHIKTKSIELASTTNDTIIKDVKRVLMTSMETGATGLETQGLLKEVFEPWVGDATLKRGEQQLKAHRLENIVRTESTQAFNQGRLVEARRPGIAESMRGMEYSAIIDARTTEVCEKLDGRVFKMNDPQLDNLRPPNHFMCRSILVPVTIFDEVNEKDFVTPSVAGQAIELAGKGFVK